jgi:hypothetical protein
MLVEKFGDLTAGELQLRQTDGAARFGGTDGWGECFHRIPGVARVKDGVVVVLQVVSVDGDVAEADQAGAALREF